MWIEALSRKLRFEFNGLIGIEDFFENKIISELNEILNNM